MYQQPPNHPPTPPSGPYPAGSYPQQPPPNWGPQQQFGPQQPFGPPQATPRKRAPLIWIIGAAAAVLVICCVGGLVLSANGFGKGSSAAASVTGTVAAPTKTAHFKVGDQVKTNNWLVVINSARTSNGDDTFSPEAGKTWVVLDVTMTNLSKASQDADSLAFELRGQDGTKYNPTLTDLPDPSGTVEAGGKTHGQIPFEVPTADKSFTLEFAPDLVDVTAIWDISV